ncbi:MAG: hypothetical protein V7603_5030 [Micromonosporaceae bacterium]
MLEMFIGCVIIVLACRFLGAVVVDLFYAGRWGKLPPRMQKRMAELAAAQKAGVPPRATFADYLQTVWGDVWEAAIAERKAKRENPTPARNKGPAKTFFSNWWNTAWENLETKRQAKNTGGNPPDAAKPGTPGAGTPPPASTTPPTPPPTTPPPASPAEPASPGPQAGTPPETPDPAAPSPGGGPSPAPASPDGTAPSGNNVIPFRRKEDPVSGGEVTGLVTAQQYAAEMSSAMGDQISATEQFVASLTGAGVTGEAIAAAQRAQELSAQASAAWQTANSALHQQDVVKEAYSTVPDAGEKGFVTAE